MKTLLIIDMQKVSFTIETPRYQTEEVVQRINDLAAIFRKNGDQVIFIQHDGSQEGNCIPNTKEWEILDSLEMKPSDLFISKTANDCFYESTLAQTIKKQEGTALYMTGCATDFCVEATIQSALTKNYDITVVKDAHTTADRPHLKAEQVIEHHNWMWQNMLPTKGSLKVVAFNELVL